MLTGHGELAVSDVDLLPWMGDMHVAPLFWTWRYCSTSLLCCAHEEGMNHFATSPLNSMVGIDDTRVSRHNKALLMNSSWQSPHFSTKSCIPTLAYAMPTASDTRCTAHSSAAEAVNPQLEGWAFKPPLLCSGELPPAADAEHSSRSMRARSYTCLTQGIHLSSCYARAATFRQPISQRMSSNRT